jgi:hypothetical protein
MLKYPDEWAFVSFYDGLGGPPIFCGLLVDQRRVDRAVGSGGFFLRLLLLLLRLTESQGTNCNNNSCTVSLHCVRISVLW